MVDAVDLDNQNTFWINPPPEYNRLMVGWRVVCFLKFLARHDVVFLPPIHPTSFTFHISAFTIHHSVRSLFFTKHLARKEPA
jgi:hypothetical protein